MRSPLFALHDFAPSIETLLSFDAPAPGKLIQGTEGNDFLQGTSGADTIKGLGGADEIYGAEGNDQLFGGNGDDTMNGGIGSDTLSGGDGNDWLSTEDADRLSAGDGDDRLSLYAVDATGTASLDAGAGNDRIEIEMAQDAVLKLAALGGDGDDQFEVQGEGYLTLDGGGGADYFTLSGPGEHMVLTLGDGFDTVRLEDGYPFGPTTVTITDFQTGKDGDSLDLYSFLADRLFGWDRSSNPFASDYLRLAQNGANTILQYHPTADGDWFDLVVLKGVALADLVAANLGGYPPDGSDPEGVKIKGTAQSDQLLGTDLYDTIAGGAGDDGIYGNAGDDILSGGKGGDVIDGGLGTNRLVGGSGDDNLVGDLGWADTLLGGAGDDILHINRSEAPVASDDPTSMDGGAGSDQIHYSGSFWGQEQVIVNGGLGNDVISAESTAAENMVTVDGGAGDDEISLHYGPFTVDAGDGNDRITLDSLREGSRITLGQGNDTIVVQSIATSGAAAEIVDMGGKDVLDLSAFALFGDPFDEDRLRLTQNGDQTVILSRFQFSWIEVIRLDGVDAGHISSKQLGGLHPGAVWLMGTDDADTLTAKDGLTHLDGMNGADVLKGSSAGDVLIGGFGADTITGGAGADTFVYYDISESYLGSADVITDLTNSDRIDLSRIDASVWLDGDQAFVLVSAFDGDAGELIVTKDGKTTLIQGDITGDQVADFTIVVNGDHHDFTNFVL